jgi:hypothetical protein
MFVRADAIEPHPYKLEPHLSCHIQYSARGLIGFSKFKMQSEQCHGASPAFGFSNVHAKPEVKEGAFDLYLENIKM